MTTLTPLLWFETEAEEAARFYVSIFKNSTITNVSRYEDAGPGPRGAVMMVAFRLDGHDVLALNGASPDAAATAQRGSVALFATCATQAELDRVWDALAEGGERLPCGWLRDRYGVSWNIVPAGLTDVLGDPDPAKRTRAMRAMLDMVKLDINVLRAAAESG